ncbi:hypothetical protein ACFE04_021580 [Oxalis oulophora]
MNRFCLWHRRYLCGSFFFFKKEFPHDTLEDPPEFVPRTGIERVIKAFSEKDPGQPSKELISVMQFMSGSLLVGFFVGGLKTGNKAYSNFIIGNQHTKFVTPYEAKGGLFWGIKAALFTGIYSFCVIGIPIYRNTEEGILEYAIGGALAGGLARAYLGVRAALGSAILVAAAASVIGLLSLLISTPMSEINNMQYGWYEWRRNQNLGSLNNDFSGNEMYIYNVNLKKVMITEAIASATERELRSSYNDHLHSRKEDIMMQTKQALQKSTHAIHDEMLSFREQQTKKKDTSGYSQSEIVYVAVTDPDEVSEPTKPEPEDKKINEQLDRSLTSPVDEITNTTQ